MKLAHRVWKGTVGALLASGVLSACEAKSTLSIDDSTADSSTPRRPTSETAEAGCATVPPGLTPAQGAAATNSVQAAAADAGGPVSASAGGTGAPGVDQASSVGGNTSEGAAGDGGGEPPAGSGGTTTADAGVGAKGGSDGGDAPGAEMRCAEDAVRCSPDSGIRELCQGGAWVPQDFVCATSVRVNTGDGAPCATKADGTFTCWWGRGTLQIWDDIVAPTPFGQLQSVESAGGMGVFLSVDGTLVDPNGNRMEDVSQFEPTSTDTCWVTKDGQARCSEFGLITELPATQVAYAKGQLCVLLEDGSILCQGGSAEPVTLDGPYTAISNSPYQVCGLDLEGTIWCTSLEGAAPSAPSSPIVGSYTKLAVNDQGVCALSDNGQLECVTFDDGESYVLSGTFTAVDAGDWSVCAIRLDGSVTCWQTKDPLGEQETWLTPEGW